MTTQETNTDHASAIQSIGDIVYLWPSKKGTSYGTSRKSDNICMYCGRGGARSFSGNGQRSHKNCLPKNKGK